MEDIFEIETNGIYTFKATTDQAKSRSKKIEINIEETDSTIEIDHDIKTPRNTTEIGSKNGIETGPIQVTIKYEENGLKKQYKKENDEEWTNVENDVQVSFAVIENTTILARYYDGTNGFQIKRYKIENVDNEGPTIESKNLTFANKNINVMASATDPSGILRYEYKKDGEEYSTTNDFPITAGGTYKIWIKAIDNAGNETIDSEEITANDYTLSRTSSTGGTVSGDSGKKFENESCTVSATANTGYYFLGWYEGATKVSTSATYTFKMPAKDYSIVARFNSIVYKITYNANGGSGAPSQQTKSHGYDITLSSTIPTKSGYEFLGWSTSNTATTATYSAGSKFSSNANTTLYAVWRKLYTITYNANGGSGAPSAQSKKHGQDITLSTTIPTRSKYDFLGWSTSNTATSATYTAGSKFTSNADTTLYAVWRRIYTVTYNANGGSGAPNVQTKRHGIDITLSSTTPTRSGYQFAGWSTSNTATSATYTAGSKFTNNADTTLYAVWKKIYTVTYNANGGSGSMSAGRKVEGSNYAIQNSTFTAPTGYTFKGWATSSSSHTVAYSAGSSYTGNSNITLYAIWYCSGKGNESKICTRATTCGETALRSQNSSHPAGPGQTITVVTWFCTKCGTGRGSAPQDHVVNGTVTTPSGPCQTLYCELHKVAGGTTHYETGLCSHLESSEHYYKNNSVKN